jgi:hypothetical protein
MSKAHPHSKKSAGENVAASSAPPTGAVSDADLRRQVEVLAEQVRRLGQSAGADPAVSEAPPAPVSPPLAPPPRPRRPVAERPMTPAEAVAAVELPEPAPEPEPESAAAAASAGAGTTGAGAAQTPAVEPAPADATTEPDGETFADRSSRLVASVVTLAQLAAVEIRANAEVEAAAIRAHSRDRLSDPTSSQLVALLDRQRRLLAGLAEQTARLEQTSAVLRAQIRALEAEREQIEAIIAASRSTS